MAKKTNRTSHVMDLLTNGASGEAPETINEAAAGGQEKKSDVQSHTVTPAKVTVVDEGSMNDRVSQEILGKLTEELDAETRKQQAQAPQETVEAQAVSQASDSSQTVQTASEASVSASETTGGSDTQETLSASPNASETAQAPASAPAAAKTTGAKKAPHPIIPESHFTSHTEDKEYRFINVMEQLLMRQKLEVVLSQNGVCTCPRCMTDVCALTLTGLPPKYVVTSKDSISPLLSYYENKYKIPILTELMKACSKVRESPRHKV